MYDKRDALAILRQHTRPSHPPNPAKSYFPETSLQMAALQKIITSPPSILIINSSDDELVPPQMGEDILNAASALRTQTKIGSGADPERMVIPSALGDTAFTRREWKEAMGEYIRMVASQNLN